MESLELARAPSFPGKAFFIASRDGPASRGSVRSCQAVITASLKRIVGQRDG